PPARVRASRRGCSLGAGGRAPRRARAWRAAGRAARRRPPPCRDARRRAPGSHSRRGALLEALDDVEDLLAVERLLDVGGGAGLEAAGGVLLAPLGADDDDRGAGD